MMNKVLHWFSRFCTIQFFLMLIAMPILIAWGLSISIFAPIGTLFFSPMLSLYLICAVVVFITELVCVPNGLCIWVLEQISYIWLWCLSLVKGHAVIGFVRPHIFILFVIPMCALFLLWVLRRYNEQLRAASLGMLLLSVCVLLKCTEYKKDMIYVIEGDHASIVCMYVDDTITLLDSKSAFARPSAASWLVYKVLPEITARTGKTTIDTIIIVHPRQRTFEALAVLAEHAYVGTIFVPWWEGRISNSAWRAYARIKNILYEHGGHIAIMRDHLPIKLSHNHILTCKKTDKKERYQNAHYTIFSIKLPSSLDFLYTNSLDSFLYSK